MILLPLFRIWDRTRKGDGCGWHGYQQHWHFSQNSTQWPPPCCSERETCPRALLGQSGSRGGWGSHNHTLANLSGERGDGGSCPCLWWLYCQYTSVLKCWGLARFSSSVTLPPASLLNAADNPPSTLGHTRKSNRKKLWFWSLPNLDSTDSQCFSCITSKSFGCRYI